MMAMMFGLRSVLAIAAGGRINRNAAEAETLQVIPRRGARR